MSYLFLQEINLNLITTANDGAKLPKKFIAAAGLVGYQQLVNNISVTTECFFLRESGTRHRNSRTQDKLEERRYGET
jgi:hypothetical protein